MKMLIVIVVVLGTLSSCEKGIFPKKNEGVLRYIDSSCGWLIQREVGSGVHSFYETTNIEDFGLNLNEGMRVKFRYYERNDLYSTCMWGQIIELTMLKKKH